jgi:hypothetical protein
MLVAPISMPITCPTGLLWERREEGEVRGVSLFLAMVEIGRVKN